MNEKSVFFQNKMLSISRDLRNEFMDWIFVNADGDRLLTPILQLSYMLGVSKEWTDVQFRQICEERTYEILYPWIGWSFKSSFDTTCVNIELFNRKSSLWVIFNGRRKMISSPTRTWLHSKDSIWEILMCLLCI